MAVSLVFSAGLAGQMVSPPANAAQESTAGPVRKEGTLLEKVMTDMPRYDETPAVAPVSQPMIVPEKTAEVVSLVPVVVFGEKRARLRTLNPRTKQALDREILRQYDYSAFPQYQYREDVRLQDMATLRNYADTLILVGDLEGGREIKRESSRLFLRPHDPESEYIDSLLNPRVR